MISRALLGSNRPRSQSVACLQSSSSCGWQLVVMVLVCVEFPHQREVPHQHFARLDSRHLVFYISVLPGSAVFLSPFEIFRAG